MPIGSIPRPLCNATFRDCVPIHLLGILDHCTFMVCDSRFTCFLANYLETSEYVTTIGKEVIIIAGLIDLVI